MPETPGALYLAHRSVIESAIRFVCRRRGLRGDEAEEFAADVRLRLVESDYEILRKFQAAAASDHLTVVIQPGADFRAAMGPRRVGSRPRRGPAAVRLNAPGRRPLADAVIIVARESRIGRIQAAAAPSVRRLWGKSSGSSGRRRA